MGLFSSIFRKKEPEQVPAMKELPEVKEEVFVDNSDPVGEPMGLYYVTRMPIDVIYAFINKNFEQEGYDDAMCNIDSTYKDSKVSIIKNELKRLFEQVRLRYKSDLRELEVQIDIVEQQGLTNTAASLKARKETFLEHMDAMSKMEDSLDKGEPQMLSMIDSYERGFLRGLAAKSDALLKDGKY